MNNVQALMSAGITDIAMAKNYQASKIIGLSIHIENALPISIIIALNANDNSGGS